MSYLGVPPFGQTVRTVTELVATAGQTDFHPAGGYLPGYIDVTLNGVALLSSDFVATDGVKVTLVDAAAASDEFKSVAYWPVSLVDTYRKGEVDSLLAAKQGSLGYTPVNKAGDTMTGDLVLSRASASSQGNVLRRIAFSNVYENPDYIASIEAVRGAYGNNIGLRLNVQQGGAAGSPVSIPALYADSDGRVTMPYQPAFYAVGGGIVSTSQGAVLPFNGAVTNRGSHFNNSTNRFTAPVSGVYLITVRITYAGSGTGTAPWIAINGSPVGGYTVFTEVFGYNSVGGYHATSAVTIFCSLTAGDFVDVRAQIYNSSSNNLDLSRSSFGGYLIG